MKLIERYLEAGSLEARSTTTVRSDWPLSRDGRVSSILSLELAAQTAAAVTEWEKPSIRVGKTISVSWPGVKEHQPAGPGFPVWATLWKQ